MHGVALDVVETLVRASQPPLSDALMQTFPCAVHLALTSDDSTVVQVRLKPSYLFVSLMTVSIEWWGVLACVRLRFTGSSCDVPRFGRQLWLVFRHSSCVESSRSNRLRVELGVRRPFSQHALQPGRQPPRRQRRPDPARRVEQTARDFLPRGRTKSHHGLRSLDPRANGSCLEFLVVRSRTEGRLCPAFRSRAVVLEAARVLWKLRNQSQVTELE